MRREVVRPLAFSMVRWAVGKSAPREALFDPLSQSRLVILYGEEVMAAFILNDVPGTFALGVKRVGGDDGSVDFQWREQFGQGRDFIALIVDGYLIF